MLMNHGGGVAGLGGRQVLVAVQGKMIGAKGVAQSVAAGWDLERPAQPDGRPLIAINSGDLVPYLAFHPPERLQPRGQRGADFYQAAAACLGVLCGDLDMARDAKHVFPYQAQGFLKAKPGQPLQGDYRTQNGPSADSSKSRNSAGR